MKQILLGLTVLLCLSACSNQAIKTNAYPTLSAVVSGQDRIRFEGKGAGAGMMLMSSLGPAGIAIGVAIDEGIAKEIHETFSRKYRFVDIVNEETVNWFEQQCLSETRPKICSRKSVQITINHYGFKTTEGDDDPVIPKLQIVIDAKSYELGSDAPMKAQPLAQIKQNASASAALLREGYQSILNRLQ